MGLNKEIQADFVNKCYGPITISTVKSKFITQGFFAQMHLYIEPLNGSIDVTSLFRRMQDRIFVLICGVR